MKNLATKIKELPHNPGVYMYKDAVGSVLYVGKATSLRSRVRQYFSGQEEKNRGQRMRNLIELTTDLEVIETESVLEALILEASLIKKYQPKFNIDGKDDKSYSYFVITHEDFPRVVILRHTDFEKKSYQTAEYKKGKIFGPYTSKEQMRIALKIIRRIFPFHSRLQKSEKGCLSYQIGMCPGPYAGTISQVEYKRNMRHIASFLSGRKKDIITSLTRTMRAHAKKEEFEQAHDIKKQIHSLEHINDIALLSRTTNTMRVAHEKRMRVECYDISHFAGEHMVASMVVFHDGEKSPSDYRKFNIKAVKGMNDVAAMREVLARRLNHLQDWGVPRVIIIDGGQGHLNMAEKLFDDLGAPATIGLLGVAKGPTRKKVDVYVSTKYTSPKRLQKDRDQLEALREEAHRFAITFHKKKRAEQKGA